MAGASSLIGRIQGHHVCGCTPGAVLVGHALLAENPDPSDDDVRHRSQGTSALHRYANISGSRAAAQ